MRKTVRVLLCMVWLVLCAALPAFGAESAPHVTAEDYASPETKAIGEKMIAQELENIPNEKTRSIAKGYVEKVAHGERDFRF